MPHASGVRLTQVFPQRPSRCRPLYVVRGFTLRSIKARMRRAKSSFIGETLTRLGVKNVVPAMLGPFPKLNPEYIVRANPELIMMGQRSAGGLDRPAGLAKPFARCVSNGFASSRPMRPTCWYVPARAWLKAHASWPNADGYWHPSPP
jgi:hypothetical protein